MAPSAIGSLAHTTPVTPRRSSRAGGGLPALERVPGVLDLVVGQIEPGDGDRAARPRSLRSDGTWSAGPRMSPMRVCPSDTQVAHRLLGRHGVVARHPRERQLVDARVDQHRRQLALDEPGVVVVRAVRGRCRARRRTARPTPAARTAARCSRPRTSRRRCGCTAPASAPAGPATRRPRRRRPGRWGSAARAGRAPRAGPARPAAWWAARSPSTSRAVSTASRVASDTPGRPLSTRLTVASLTPTFSATSVSRPTMTRKHTQDSASFRKELASRLAAAADLPLGRSATSRDAPMPCP